MKSIRSSWFPVSIGIIFFTAFYFKSVSDHYGYATKSKHNDPEDWQPPDINLVPQNLRKRKKKISLTLGLLNIPKESVVVLIGGLFVPLLILCFLLQMMIFFRYMRC